MDKHIINEKTGISYTLQGDYYLPDLALPPEEKQPIGIWGQRHLRYLKQHRKVFYANLLTSGKLNDYLAGIDGFANNLFGTLLPAYKQRYGITEQLKAKDQMEWVKRSNVIHIMITEVIEQELNG